MLNTKILLGKSHLASYFVKEDATLDGPLTQFSKSPLKFRGFISWNEAQAILYYIFKAGT